MYLEVESINRSLPSSLIMHCERHHGKDRGIESKPFNSTKTFHWYQSEGGFSFPDPGDVVSILNLYGQRCCLIPCAPVCDADRHWRGHGGARLAVIAATTLTQLLLLYARDQERKLYFLGQNVIISLHRNRRQPSSSDLSLVCCDWFVLSSP